MEVFDDSFLAIYSNNYHLDVSCDRLFSHENYVTVKQFRENAEAFPKIKSIPSLIVEAELCQQHIDLGSA